jgi:hypothetical protein
MSKNGPTTTRIGFSPQDAIKSKVPIVPTRTNGQINLENCLKTRPDLRPLVEAKLAKGWGRARIMEWLKEKGHLGRWRLKAWLNKAKTKPARTEYASSADELRERADDFVAKRIYRKARLAEFSTKSGTWKKRDRWSGKGRK